jgi:replicative DNA helicase
MTDDKAFTKITDLIKADSFYKPEHKVIFGAASRLYEKNQPIEMITVVTELRRSNELQDAGGVSFVAELTDKVTSAANIEHHARILQQYHIQREIIKAGSQLQTMGHDETADPLQVLDDVQQMLFNVMASNTTQPFADMRALGVETLKHMDVLSATGVTGLRTGLTALDDLMGGLQGSDLTILAARPGMGKTSLALCIARNVAKQGKRVGVFSLEMSSMQLHMRLSSIHAKVNSEHMRSGTMSIEERQSLNNAVTELSKMPIYVDDTSAIAIFELRSKARKLMLQHGLDLLIIDYLQLMRGRGDTRGNREQEVTQISQGLKALAKDLNIPIIALAQLNRDVDKRGTAKRPMLADLRESGSIENDADQVLFIHRPEYYGVVEDSYGTSTVGMAEVIVAKNRHGRTDTVKMRFDASTTSFEDWTTTIPMYTTPSTPVITGNQEALPF